MSSNEGAVGRTEEVGVEGSEEVGGASSKEELEGVPADGGGVESANSGNDIIESAAQIKVDQSIETAAESGSHSPIPPAQSGSHFPIPVSVAGDRKSPTASISVEMESKSMPCETVQTSDYNLELKPG